jgi:hypothetical protein
MCFDLKEIFGIKDLADNIEAVKKELRLNLRSPDHSYHTFTVQKPFCCPCSPKIKQALTPYGVKIIKIGEDKLCFVSVKDFSQMMRIEFKRFDNLRYGPGMLFASLPIAMQCTVTVYKSQAEWAEYLIERTKRICVISGGINSKNRDWANKHNGNMPKPWVEKSCESGNSMWEQVSQIMKDAKEGKPVMEMPPATGRR